MTSYTKYNEFSEIGPKRQQKSGFETDPIDRTVISYLTLRRFIGFLGIILPIVLLLGSKFNSENLLPSISHYFHSCMKIAFVGIIFSIAVFLWCHNGDDHAESLLTKAASLCAILVVICPTKNDLSILNEGTAYYLSDFKKFVQPTVKEPEFVGYFHFICAAFFFTILIILILWKFKNHEKKSSNPSIGRLWFYNISGWGMVLCIAIIFISHIFGFAYSIFPVTFLCETIALILFGLAWLVKGEAEEIIKKSLDS